MGKATGKHDREPDIKTLVPTNHMVAVRAFAMRNRISEGAALRALLSFALDHEEQVEWRVNMTPPIPIEQSASVVSTLANVTQRQQQLSLPAPCTAQRAQFSPRENLKNATSYQV